MDGDWAVTIDYNERGNIVSNGSENISDSATVEIVVNGTPREVPKGLSIEELLRHLDVDPSRVAVEWNRQIVRKAEWANHAISAGDAFEVVWFVGGG